MQFGDGRSSIGSCFSLLCSPLDSDAMDAAIEIMNDESVAFKWHLYDAIFIDNHATMHARKPFVPPRRILASLAV